MALQWSTDFAEGDWLRARIRGFGENVGSVVPHGYEAYARIFHPIPSGPISRWSDLALDNGRIAHPEMQLQLISRPVGETAPVSYELPAGFSVGSLPRDETSVLSEVLVEHTAAPGSCWFAVWEGFGQLHGSPAVSPLAVAGAPVQPVPGLVPEHLRTGGRLHLPHRGYFMLHGSVGDAVDVFDRLLQSPNLWWPADHDWCVASEIDFGWTYVGGSERAISAVLSSPHLEAMPASLTDGIGYDSDRVNAALDG